MHEYSELHPDESKAEVGNCQAEAHPPPIVWEAHHQHAYGALGRGAGQLWHVRIAADHPVHDDEIGRLHLGADLREVHHPTFDAISQTSFLEQFAGSRFVGWCQLNVDRSDDTSVSYTHLTL